MHTIRVDVGASKGRIAEAIYGHFAEHLGRGIYEGICVGPQSSIPHIDGIRTDVVEALKAIKVPVIRWPGGCFADEYHWKDGIGPVEERRAMVNRHWGQVLDDNHFGTHEFFRLCELVGCEAYVAGNVGSGTVQEMTEWVEYMTGPETSPMGALRARNGHPDPWAVKFFGVGNESWGCGGNMRPEYYADVYRRYQTFLPQYRSDHRMQKIASGSHDGDMDWTEVLMREAAAQMDGLSLHYYTIPSTWEHKGSATNFGLEEWFTTLKKALVLEDWIQMHGEVMDRYDPTRTVGLVVDEWGTWYDVEPGTHPGFLYQQNTLRDALVAAVSLNIFNNHCDRVMMANLAQTVNVLQALILTQGAAMITTPTYQVFRLYAVHQGNRQVATKISTRDYSVGGEAIDQLHASASQDAGGVVHLSVVNLHPQKAASIQISMHQGDAPWRIAEASAEVLSAPEITSKNTWDTPNQVRIQPLTGIGVRENWLDVTLPAKSVVELRVVPMAAAPGHDEPSGSRHQVGAGKGGKG